MWFKRKQGSAVTEEDLRRRARAEAVGEHQELRTEEAHREITRIIIRNHIGDMLQKSLQPREGK